MGKDESDVVTLLRGHCMVTFIGGRKMADSRNPRYCAKCGYLRRGPNHDAGHHHKVGKDGRETAPRKTWTR